MSKGRNQSKIANIVPTCNVAIFKNVVHNLEPGERPSDSGSHQVPNYAQHS